MFSRFIKCFPQSSSVFLIVSAGLGPLLSFSGCSCINFFFFFFTALTGQPVKYRENKLLPVLALLFEGNISFPCASQGVTSMGRKLECWLETCMIAGLNLAYLQQTEFGRDRREGFSWFWGGSHICFLLRALWRKVLKLTWLWNNKVGLLIWGIINDYPRKWRDNFSSPRSFTFSKMVWHQM